jgi:hypothetical protein
LRFEQKALPFGDGWGRTFASRQQYAPRHSESVAAQDGFSVDLGQTHNATFPPAPSGALFPWSLAHVGAVEL